MADVFADIPEGYTRDRIDPQLRKYLVACVEEITTLLDGKLTRILDGTPYLEMTTMQNKKKDLMLMHLVNYDVLLDGTVTPAQNVQLEVLIPKGKEVRRISYSGDLDKVQSIPFEASGETIQFRIPNVDIYGLSVIEF